MHCISYRDSILVVIQPILWSVNFLMSKMISACNAQDFWREFSAAAGVFSLGEVFDGRVEVLAQYLGNGTDSLFDYPTFYTLRDVFQRKESMTLIPYRRGQQRPFFSDVRIFGTFLENHDNRRFLHDQKDRALYRYEVHEPNAASKLLSFVQIWLDFPCFSGIHHFS